MPCERKTNRIRTLYQNGVHYDSGWYGTPEVYQATDATPPTPSDSTSFSPLS